MACANCREECPVCMEPLPLDMKETRYKECCGTTQCLTCQLSQLRLAHTTSLRACAFCRAPEAVSAEEYIERLEKRVTRKDPTAAFLLYMCKSRGMCGATLDIAGGLAMLHTAAELGHPDAMFDLGFGYFMGKINLGSQWIPMDFDVDQAQRWYERVVKTHRRAQGHDVALANLGAIAYAKQDFRTAQAYYRQAASGGIEHALKDYEHMYRQNLGGITDTDLRRTRSAFHHQSESHRLNTSITNFPLDT